MQLRQFRFVTAIVRHQSMRRAAQELFVSESTMSQQVHALEQELGFPLFERSHRALRLTPEGERILPEIETLIAAKDHFDQQTKTIREEEPRVIRLGINAFASMVFLAPMYQEFRRLYPEIILDITEVGTYASIQYLQQGRLDLALFSISEILVPKWNELLLHPLYKTEGVLLASRHHYLAHRERISKAQLRNEITITYSHEYLAHQLFETVLGELQAITMLHQPDSIFTLVHEGMSLAMAPYFLVGTSVMETHFPDLRMLDLAPGIQFPISYVCGYSHKRRLSEPIKTLIAIMHECFSRLPRRS